MTLYTSGQVAPRVALRRAQLQYLIESGQIPGPSVRVPGRWLFSEEDVRRIVKAIEEKPALRAAGKKPE